MKTLEQKKFFHGRKRFELLEKGRIKVISSSIKGKNEEVFNLFDLDYQCDKYFNRPLKFLAMATSFFLLSVLFYMGMVNYTDKIFLSIALIFFALSLIYIQQYFYKKTDLIVYRYHRNGHAAIMLWNHLPNDEELTRFTQNLSKEIECLRVRPDLNKEQKLEIYKNSIELLLGEHVITEEEAISIYERTKKRMYGKGDAKLFSIS